LKKIRLKNKTPSRVTRAHFVDHFLVDRHAVFMGRAIIFSDHRGSALAIKPATPTGARGCDHDRLVFPGEEFGIVPWRDLAWGFEIEKAGGVVIRAWGDHGWVLSGETGFFGGLRQIQFDLVAGKNRILAAIAGPLASTKVAVPVDVAAVVTFPGVVFHFVIPFALCSF
jgi:hypothetical protein